MRRRNLLIRLGLLGAGLGGAWWLRDNVVWRRPDIAFGDPAWLPWAERRSNLPTVTVALAGRQFPALIDSGAQYSVIDRTLFASLGVPKTFDMPMIAYGMGGGAQIGKGATLDLAVGQTRIPDLRAAILDLGPLASEAGLGTPLILGQDVLGEMLFDMDVDGRRLRFLPRGTALPDAVVPVEVRRAGRALTTTVSVEGAVVNAVIDTGASSLISLGRDAAGGAGLLDGRPQRESKVVVLGGAVSSRVVRARTVTFGDRLYRDVEAAIFDDVAVPGFPAALIGMDAFAGQRVVMDLGGAGLHVSRALDLTVEPPRRRPA